PGQTRRRSRRSSRTRRRGRAPWPESARRRPIPRYSGRRPAGARYRRFRFTGGSMELADILAFVIVVGAAVVGYTAWRRQVVVRALGVVGAVVVAGVVWVAGATFKGVPVDKIGLHYTGGLFQGQHFKGVISPGTHTKYYGEFDKVYLLPSTQRTYIVSKDPAA